MSLTITLVSDTPRVVERYICVREGGRTRMVPASRYPGADAERETFLDYEVWWGNITHNLTEIAAEAGLYDAVWRPDENGFDKAAQIVPVLANGIVELHDRKEYYKQFDASNGWGTYEQFVEFLLEYFAAAVKYPDAKIEVSR